MNVATTPLHLKVTTTYDAAADHFDDPGVEFWQRHGRRTVEQLALRPGSRVLDVGCGTGASALPAARTVGPTGHVTGIDLAENMLARARAKAAADGIDNVTFTVADMTALDGSSARYDAIVSVFSIFFVPDMARQVATLWRLLEPGGQLAITVWGPGAMEPAAGVFGEEVRRVRPDIPVAGRPWERLTEPENLRRLLQDAGTATPELRVFADKQPPWQAADWWTIAMGSGYRWEIDQLTPGQRETVRRRTIDRLTDMGVRMIETGALAATARKT